MNNLSKKRSYLTLLKENTDFFKFVGIALLIILFFLSPLLTAPIYSSYFSQPETLGKVGIVEIYIMTLFINFLLTVATVLVAWFLNIAWIYIFNAVKGLCCLRNLRYLPVTVEEIKSLNLSLPELFVKLAQMETVYVIAYCNRIVGGYEKDFQSIEWAPLIGNFDQINKEVAKNIMKCYSEDLNKANKDDTFTELLNAYTKTFGESYGAEKTFRYCLKAFVPTLIHS